MIEVIRLDGGTFNLVGVEDGMFVLQGNLTKKQLKELLNKVEKALKEAS